MPAAVGLRTQKPRRSMTSASTLAKPAARTVLSVCRSKWQPSADSTCSGVSGACAVRILLLTAAYLLLSAYCLLLTNIRITCSGVSVRCCCARKASVGEST